MSRCGIVILAAGSASRMGEPKQLMKLDGVSLLRRCALTTLATECRPVFVVLGANAPVLRGEVGDLGMTVLINPDWAAGMGTSIRVGVSAVMTTTPPPGAVALVLCDQPLITADSICRVVAAREQSGKAIAAAAYGGSLGTPAVFAASLFGELTALADDQGGKAVIARHKDNLHLTPLPEAAFDVDTPGDIERLRAMPNALIVPSPGTPGEG